LAEQQPGGSITLTPVRALVVAAVFGGLAGWLIVVIGNALGLIPPRIPWTAPIGLAVFAALVGVLAWSTHQRIQVRRERVEPSRAVAFLVLGKASALAGALVAGGYLGFALMFVDNFDAAAPQDRVIRSGVAVVAGVALCIAGLRLERACKVPGADDDDEEPPGPPPTR
jgi:4-amino-4-deoxy-L-arabinose transferase-like glycosyltransferase